MRIAISATQCIGKTTLVKDFLKNWPMYETSKKTYRDLIREKNLPINKETTPETQSLLMDCICDEIMTKSRDDFFIMDRSPIDCLVYSLWANLKGIEGFDDEFIKTQILLAREATSFFDIIFYIPINKYNNVEIVSDNFRDIDPEYRMEIDNIFHEIYRTYSEKIGPYFNFEDCPAVIEIFGNEEERIEMIGFYVNENGNAYGEDESLISDITID